MCPSFRMSTNGAAGLGRRTLSPVGELRLGSVAFELKVEVWSEKKSEMLVAEIKEVTAITRGECMEEEDERTRAGTLRESKSRQNKETKAPENEHSERREGSQG